MNIGNAVAAQLQLSGALLDLGQCNVVISTQQMVETKKTFNFNNETI